MNTTILVDNNLINEALELGEVKSEKDLVDLALRSFIETQKQKKLLELKGKIEFFEDYDYKSMRGSI